MQSRDNHLDRSTAPGFRVLAQPSRSPTPLQQTRPDPLPPPIFLSRCVTKSTHVPFARRSLDVLDHSIPIERLAEGLLQIAVSRTPRPEHSLSPSKFTAPGRSRYSAKDFAPAMGFPPELSPLILPGDNLPSANPPPSADSAQRQATSGADRAEPNRAAENASAVCFDTTYGQLNSLTIRAQTLCRS